jgi:CheY-specific phosphatase CheX
MYFMVPVYLGKIAVPAAAYKVGVGFTGAVAGEFHLAVAHHLADRMAADFLASEVNDVDQQQVEANVRELANVACCAAMAAWRPGDDFHFTVPFLLGDDAQLQPGHAFSILSGNPEISFEVRVAE